MEASDREFKHALNPYASVLGEKDPYRVIATTPHTLAAIIGRTSEERHNRSPAPGKWSIREILCHLADCELVFGFRLRQTVAEASHVIQPFDQEAWQAPYRSLSAHDALAAFSAARDARYSVCTTIGTPLDLATVFDGLAAWARSEGRSNTNRHWSG